MTEERRIRPKKYESKQIQPPTDCPKVPNAIPIRELAFEKSKKAAELVFSEIGPYEYLGLLFGADGIVEEVYLPEGQQDTEVETRLEEFDASQLPERLKQYRLLGWVHSHASWGADFLSPTDERNIRWLNSLTNNYLDPDNHDAKYVYSIVVNRRGDSNAYIDAQLQCGASYRKSVGLRLLEGGQRYTEDCLKQEIRAKINVSRIAEPEPETAKEKSPMLEYVPRTPWEIKVSNLLHKGYSLTKAVQTIGFPHPAKQKEERRMP